MSIRRVTEHKVALAALLRLRLRLWLRLRLRPTYHVGTDHVFLVSQFPGSIFLRLQPAIVILLAHGEGYAAGRPFAMVIAIAETLAAEILDVCAPEIGIVVYMSFGRAKGVGRLGLGLGLGLRL